MHDVCAPIPRFLLPCVITLRISFNTSVPLRTLSHGCLISSHFNYHRFAKGYEYLGTRKLLI
ncbi:MAG: hypothetical protein ACXADU_14190 [Promethearchaeota archaeon]